MRIIYLIIFFIISLFSCKKNREIIIDKNKNTSTTIKNDKIYYKSCEEILIEVIKSSNVNALKKFKNLNIRIESKANERFVIELYIQNNISEESSINKIADQTVGWLEFFPSERKLQDITNDPETPEILTYNKSIINNIDFYKVCGFTTDKNSNETNNSSYKNFENLFNKVIVGLSIIDEKEKDPYKKYGLDFNAICLCDAPSFFIDTKSSKFTIFNYCDSNYDFKEIKNKYSYKITKIEAKNKELVITTSESLKIKFYQTDNKSIYKMNYEGNIPTDFVGSDLKNLYTSEYNKFVTIDCGDFSG